MNVRTGQETFGSYHPNDIKEDISKFFKDNGGQVHSDNHWGLMVYNPNAAMPQYMGELPDPGNLVPGFQGQDETGNHENQNAPEPMQVAAFNPNELNRQLMQSVQSSSMNIKEGAIGTFGFNPDAVNRQLMMSVISQGGQSQYTSGGSHSSSATSAGKTSGGSSQDGTASNQNIGYNADQVNAGLYNSINYDPNNVNSANVNMPSFGTSVHGVSGSSGNSASSAGNSGTGKTSTGTGVSQVGGSQNGINKAQKAGGGNSQSSQNSAANIQQAGASMTGAVQATGIGGLGSYGPFAAGGNSGGNQNGGRILPSTRISQNGLPPGVPAGMSLSQTEADAPVANGIGGLGV